MTDSKLVAIPPNDWLRLRNLYRQNWPANLLGFYTVDTFLRWQEQETEIKHLIIYSLDGDWEKDGTYVCIHRYQLFANTLDASLVRLERMLHLLDWSRGYKVSTLLDRFRPAVQTVIDTHQYSLEFDSRTFLYYLPQEMAIELDTTCPPGITLGALNGVHAQTINDAWPNRHTASLFLVQKLIKLSPTVGAFDETGQLVAWCLRLQAGVHGILQVLETHKRRGLGSLVCKALSKKLAEAGIDSCACVNLINLASQKTFERCGFRLIDHAYWLRTIPTIPNDWTD